MIFLALFHLSAWHYIDIARWKSVPLIAPGITILKFEYYGYETSQSVHAYLSVCWQMEKFTLGFTCRSLIAMNFLQKYYSYSQKCKYIQFIAQKRTRKVKFLPSAFALTRFLIMLICYYKLFQDLDLLIVSYMYRRKNFALN